MSLKVLPIYLALTQTLLIVAGPTYHTRLWCIVEVFTFLRMGAALERVHLRPMLAYGEGGATEADEAARIADIRLSFSSFRIQEAECYSADKAILFGAIETGFASLEEFNALCSAAMVRAVDHSCDKVASVGEATRPVRALRVSSFTTAADGDDKPRRLSNTTAKGGAVTNAPIVV